MKKLIILGMLIFGFSQIAFATAVEEGVNPDSTIQNTKGFAGRQVIVNDHSAFNININIFKKGALFKNEEEKQGGQ